MTNYQFTCISCRAGFRDAESQRTHYKSDWHRYNLKRKVANFEPVSVEEFTSRVLAAREANVPKSTTQYCKPCSKSFNTKNSFENHINSKKHKLAEESYVEKPEKDEGEEIKAESDDDTSSYEEINDIFPNDCLFCNSHSRTVVKNLTHMATAHSFFIPDAEYCVDLEGFLTYLGQKVSEGFMCLWCDEKGREFQSLEATQAHMRDKGHCKLLHEGAVLAEYADFYDYSSSYPDHVEGDENMEVDPDETAILPSTSIDDEEFQLVLPSGAVIGHRSLLRYYKQNLSSHSGAGSLVKKSDDKIKRIIHQYRCLGWAPQQSDAIAKKAKDIRYLKKAQAKWNMQLGVKANKLQKHFRVQCNF